MDIGVCGGGGGGVLFLVIILNFIMLFMGNFSFFQNCVCKEVFFFRIVEIIV